MRSLKNRRGFLQAGGVAAAVSLLPWRAQAAESLISQYERLDADIRTIQLRLYDIAVTRDQNGFAEEIRQCTKRDSLDAVYSCMSAAFNSAATSLRVPAQVIRSSTPRCFACRSNCS